MARESRLERRARKQMANLDTAEGRFDALDPEEKEVYTRYMASGKPPVSPATAQQFYNLYLRGCSAKDIQAMNPSFDLGMIVRAKMDNDWDLKRKDYTEGLVDRIQETVQASQLESVQFVSLWAAAFNKLNGDKLRRFVQTGKEEDLGDLKGQMTLKAYQQTLELLLRLTGQDKDKNVSGEILHTHRTEDKGEVVDGQSKEIKAMSPDDVDNALVKILEKTMAGKK